MARFVLWGEPAMYGHHDSYAQYVFERPENAEALFRFLLPAGLVARVDWATLNLERSTFTHPALRAALGDLLYSVRLRDTGQLAFLMLEHRSSEARDMAERLLKYEVRHLATWRRRNPHAREVPMVLGVVLYHGQEDWKAPRQLQQMMGLPLQEVQSEGWERLVMHPEHVLGNLRRRREEELLAVQGPPLVRLALLLMRFGRTGQLRDKLLEWLPVFQEVYATPTGPEDLETSVAYVRVLGDKRTDEVLRRVLSSLIEVKQAEELMQTVGQKIWQEGLLVGELRGVAKGRTEGLVEGKAEGRAEDILRILAARGVSMDDKSRHRILSCRELELLDLWFDRALHATRLSDVLRDPVQ